MEAKEGKLSTKAELLKMECAQGKMSEDVDWLFSKEYNVDWLFSKEYNTVRGRRVPLMLV
jgi:hypothetical protein